jgi:glycosyltransferase involved in cell wall biosynthesis
MQAFINHFGIPWYKCAVIQNAIEPLAPRKRIPGKVRLIYHTTPHRGLNILLSAFDAVVKHNPHIDVTLDVYSSFKIYGWEQRDEQYQDLFDICKNHPKINYHGTVSNAEVKKAISNADIFAYPSVWPETSCISLIEAMSAGLTVVHSNLAALPETAANWTQMYQYQSNERDHVNVFVKQLAATITLTEEGLFDNMMEMQKVYINNFYHWDMRKSQWESLLKSI